VFGPARRRIAAHVDERRACGAAREAFLGGANRCLFARAVLLPSGLCPESVFDDWSTALQGQIDLLSRRIDLFRRMSLPAGYFRHHLETFPRSK
jgi:hypothetical protein